MEIRHSKDAVHILRSRSDGGEKDNSDDSWDLKVKG